MPVYALDGKGGLFFETSTQTQFAALQNAKNLEETHGSNTQQHAAAPVTQSAEQQWHPMAS